MPRYQAVTWLHEFPDEPVELLSEVVSDQEVRKIEKFRNGQVGWAGPDSRRGATMLGEVPMPTIEEINSDPQFLARPITRGEFEKEWRIATSGKP